MSILPAGWNIFQMEGTHPFFTAPIEDTENLVVPVLVIYEVSKRLLTSRDEQTALVLIGDMNQGRIAEVTAPIALQAAKLSADLKLAMADSLILAAARAHHASLWNQDADFEKIDGVRYVRGR